MDQQLMIGILLIVVGAAFASIAVAVVLNRRAGRGELAGEATAAAAQQPDSAADLLPNNDDQSDVDAEDEGESEQAEAESEDEPEQAHAELDDEVTGLELLAELYREQGTGDLILRSGDQEFRSLSQITRKAERDRLARAAADLAKWFSTGDRAEPAERSSEGSADSMVRAIDAILQRTSEASDRGVRLVPGGTGGVKVLIGVKSYEMDEVPDKEIRRLIREAVAEWEATQ